MKGFKNLNLSFHKRGPHRRDAHWIAILVLCVSQDLSVEISDPLKIE